MEFVNGCYVWLQQGTQLAPGKIVGDASGGKASVEHLETKQLLTVAVADLRVMSESSQRGVADLTQLSLVHENTILYNLRLRFFEDHIYTYMGNILVSVNPYRVIPGLYALDVVEEYDGVPVGELPPHIFALANASYYSLQRGTKNQCVIISGESGAGKTEATKLIIQNFASLSTSRSLVQDQIIEANPILELFGNAKTVRNDNSSRFGKFIEVQFGVDGSIKGARILDYLLEKSRIVHQSTDERNYHVFYSLLAGADEALKRTLKLASPKEFHYLNQSGCVSVSSIDDLQHFIQLQSAMKLLGFSEVVDNIYEVLAAILHMGNIIFKEKQQAGTGNQEVELGNSDLSNFVAELLGVDPATASHHFVTRTIENRENFSKITTPLNMDQARDARDALAKALYGRMFSWILGAINETICATTVLPFVGVLDIFGFEDFTWNSFEQLCINYANETLQFYFNQHVFQLEQEEYNKEGIEWKKIEFSDNQECIDLINKKPTGLFALLDEESNFPQGTDLSLLDKLGKNCSSSAAFETSKTKKEAFTIVHYAGKVEYQVDGFLDKNRDTLRQEWMDLFETSKKAFVGKLFAQKGVTVANEKSGSLKTLNTLSRTGGGRRTGSKIPTVSAQFNTSLQALVGTLSTCNPYFVRCVKPNKNKLPKEFDSELTLKQLRYSGMMETVRIRAAGHPIRLGFKEFINRYGFLAPTKESDQQKISAHILSTHWKVADDYRVGKTKVFLRNQVENVLEAKRGEKIEGMVIRIQKTARMFVNKRRYKKSKKSVVEIQRIGRGWVSRKKYERDRKHMIRLQAIYRGHLGRKVYHRMVEEEKERKRKAEEEERRRREEERRRLEEERRKREEEERRRIEEERKRLEEEARKRAEEEARARAEIAARAKAEAEARAKAEQLAKTKAEQEAVAKARALAEAEAAKKAEAEAKAEALKKADEEARKEAEERVRIRKEEEAKRRAQEEKQIERPMSVIEIDMKKIMETVDARPAPSVNLVHVPSFIATPKNLPLLHQKELSMEHPSFALLVDLLNSENSPPHVLALAKALGESAEHATFQRYAQVSFASNISYTYYPDNIPRPLLHMPTSLNINAVTCFAVLNDCIQKEHMYDDARLFKALNFVIENAAKSPYMYDEVLVQLCKQTIENPDPKKEFQAWKLLSIMLGFFPPSPKLYPTLLHHIVNNGPSALAGRLQFRLWRGCMSGPRRYRMSSIEYMGLCKRVPVALHGGYADDLSVIFEVDASSTADEVVHTMLATREILVDDGYQLVASYNDTEFVMQPYEHVLDIICQLEGMIPPEEKDKAAAQPHAGGDAPAEAVSVDAPSFAEMGDAEAEAVMENMKDLDHVECTMERGNRGYLVAIHTSKKGKGTIIKKVERGGPGDVAGLMVGDLIQTIDGVDIRGWTERQVVNELKTKSMVVVAVMRKKKEEKKKRKKGEPPAPPVRNVSLSPQSASLLQKRAPFYPWRISLRKCFITPSSKNIDSRDVALTVSQILASKNAKEVKSTIEQLQIQGEAEDIIEYALGWPLYFCRIFPCIESKTGASEFAFDHLGVYFVLNKKKIIRFCPYLSLKIIAFSSQYVKISMESDEYDIHLKIPNATDALIRMIRDLVENARKCVALRQHDATDWNLLAFNKGDYIDVLDKSEGWVAGVLHDKVGWFPGSAVQLIYGWPPGKDQYGLIVQKSIEELMDAYAKAEEAGKKDSAAASKPSEDKGDASEEDTNSVTGSDLCMLDYAKLHFRYDAGKDERASFAGGTLTMRGTLKKLGTVTKKKEVKAPESPSVNDEELTKEMTVKVKYTKDPIRAALHKYIASSADHKLAIDSFQLIMAYMGDFPSKKSRFKLVQKLATIALKNSNMYDEIFAQIVRQLTRNTSSNPLSLKRGWDLLLICSSCFTPTSLLMPYISYFLSLYRDRPNNQYSNIAKDCVERINRTNASAMVRMLPPSEAEILALEMGTPMSTTVYLPGDFHYTITIESFTSASEVLSKTLARAKLPENDTYGLYLVPAANRISGLFGIPVSDKDPIVDVLTLAESLASKSKKGKGDKEKDKDKDKSSKTPTSAALDDDDDDDSETPPGRNSSDSTSSVGTEASVDGKDKTAAKARKGGKEKSRFTGKSSKKGRGNTNMVGLGLIADGESGAPSTKYVLVCKKKLFVGQGDELELDQVVDILFHQRLADYLSGTMLSIKELEGDFLTTAAQLAALLLKVMPEGMEMRQVVPQILWKLKDSSWWHKQIPDKLAGVKQATPTEYRRQILQILEKLELYDTNLFAIKSSPDPRLPNGAVISLNIDGINILDLVSKLPVVHCSFQSLIDYRYDHTEIVMHTGDLMNKTMLSFQTTEGFPIADLIDSYIQVLLKNKEAENPKGKGRKNMKKYSPF